MGRHLEMPGGGRRELGSSNLNRTIVDVGYHSLQYAGSGTEPHS